MQTRTCVHAPVQIVDARKLTNQKWLNLFDVTYIDRAGSEGHWQLATRLPQPKCVTHAFRRPDAVVIVPFHSAREQLVVTREFRVPLAGFEYGFPAGLVDGGETIEDTARRELREETGLTLTRFLKIGPPIYSSAGMTDETVSMVYVQCSGEPSTAGNEDSELIEVLFLSAAEAQAMCADAQLKIDAKAYLVLSAFAQSGRIV